MFNVEKVKVGNKKKKVIMIDGGYFVRETTYVPVDLAQRLANVKRNARRSKSQIICDVIKSICDSSGLPEGVRDGGDVYKYEYHQHINNASRKAVRRIFPWISE